MTEPSTPDQPTPEGSPMKPEGVLAPPPPPPYHPGAAYMPPSAPPRRSGNVLTRVATGLISSLLLLSIVANFYFGAWFFASTMGGIRESVYREGDKSHRIVVVPAKGVVGTEMEDFIRNALKHLDKVQPRAIVLRVDSPGGDPFASDRIVYMLDRFKEAHPDIPVISSYGTVAASGGYYISAGTDHIFAEPLCRTGSIGVMSMSFTMAGLLEKVGVKPEVQVATGSPQKDIANNPFRDFTPVDRQEVQRSIDQLHDRFVDIVHKGRADHLSREAVQQLADGKIYTADEAKEARLVDEIGFLDDAIDYAQAQANLPPDVTPEVTVIQQSMPFSVLNLVSSGGQAPPQAQAETVRQWLLELSTPKVEYRYVPQW